MLTRESFERWRDGLLLGWARFVTGRPRLAIGLCVALAVVSAGYASLTLGFESDRSALIDPELPWQRRYAEFKAQFPRWDDAVVVVETGGDPDDAAVGAFLDALAARLGEDGRFPSVMVGFPTADAPAGLILSEPVERIETVARELRLAQPAMSAASVGNLLQLAALGAGRMGDAEEEELRALLERIERAGDTGASVLGAPGEVQRLASPTGELVFGLVGLPRDDGIGGWEEGVRALRGHLRAVQREERFAGIDAGVTGTPVLETDETAQAVRDASRTSALAMALVVLTLALSFGGVSVPLMAGLSLLLGLAASFGWAAVSVGRLQVLSVVFMIILVGLGADMAIHLIARLEVVQRAGRDVRDAVREAFLGAGPGILTGTLTTAAAFGATGLTRFAGVAELGILASGGIVLCTIVALTAFPAMLCLSRAPEARLRAREGGVSRPFMRGRLDFVDRRPRWTIGVWAALVVVFGGMAGLVRYDPDLLKLLPESTESVRWEKRLSADDERSVWHAVVLAPDAESAAQEVERLRGLDVVGGLDGAARLFPEGVAEKLERLRTIPEPVPVAQGEGVGVREAAGVLAQAFEGRDAEIAEAARAVAAMGDAEAARVEASFREDQETLRTMAESLRGVERVRAEELPEALREQWIGRDGSYLIQVYPRAAEGSALAPSRLNPFAEGVLEAAPGATGPAIQIFKSTRVILKSHAMAALLAAMAIVVILALDFRNAADVGCALAPVAAATALLLGGMGALGLTLNFANTIVAPLLMGLGVTAGVHATHRWRQRAWDRPAGLAGGAGRAITLTLATTAIGFACMMLAQHRGLRSLGAVMTAGLALVWCGTALLLPAMFRLRTRLGHVGIGRREPGFERMGEGGAGGDGC